MPGCRFDCGVLDAMAESFLGLVSVRSYSILRDPQCGTKLTLKAKG
jgi:hypothetical protein